MNNHSGFNSSLVSIVAALCVAAVMAPLAMGKAKKDEFPQPLNTEKSTGHSMTPGDVCKSARLPPGFLLRPFAAEPDVQNPISITTDDRGRLWVAENYTWAGADAGDFDAKLKDRVIILEDSNSDGYFDKRTVFFDRAKRLTGVQVGMGGAWLLCPPQLLFVPDRNRDDIPDGAPEVVLDGFNIKTASHTVANGLKWGPDGWLYGREGILGTSKIRVPGADDAHRVTMNTGVWRYHPTRHVYEVVMHGMTNPWGFDYDPFGEMFVTNTVIGHLWHVVPGARTERMSGTDFNSNAYQLISQVADHVHWNTSEVWNDVRKGVTSDTNHAGGGHAHAGLMIYQGDNWPAEYRGRPYTLNLHGRRMNCDILARKPVGYVATHGPDMCFIADPWFRGMDVISGADGGVFIADWSDTGECHELGGVHRTSGRIYKLTFGEIRAGNKFDLVNASDEQLVQMQLQKNDWFTRRARLLLQERASTGNLAAAECRDSLLKIFSHNTDPVIRVRAMWALYLSQCVDEKWLLLQLQDPDEHVRVWAVRFITDAHRISDTDGWSVIAEELTSLAGKDNSGLVLLYLASALQKMPAEMRWPLAKAISVRPERAFAGDRTLSIMLWLGIEPVIAARPARSLQLIQQTTFLLVRENIARRLTLEIDRDTETVEKLLALAAGDPKAAPDILRGVAAALQGRKKPPVPSNWSEVSDRLTSFDSRDTSDSVKAIGIAFQDAKILSSLRRTIEDPVSKPDERSRALQLLLTARPKGLNEVLRGLVKDPNLALAAIRGLAFYDDPEVPTTILDNYSHLTPEERAAAINTMSSRVSYAKALVKALELKRLPPTDISAFQARQIIALGNTSLTDRMRALWGDARQTSHEKRRMVNNLRAVLTPRIAEADIENGKILFKRTCATCHVLFGEGARIGPELTGSNRKNLDYLLENIVDPSAVVGAEFRVSVFVLSDGRVVSGIVREQNERTITVQTPDNKQVIDRQDVDEATVSNKSLMPDGMLQDLSDSQIRDLLAYLMSN